MAKKVAVLAVNPVNGFGLFQYLEAFFENGISYKVYAVAETKQIKTNSGVELVADDIIAHLVGHEDEFDAVVFAAAIVHRKDITDEALYYRVNAQLPYEFAQKAKEEGVKRFLFLSTAAVYGVGKTLPNTMTITGDMPLAADDLYGKSKLEG